MSKDSMEMHGNGSSKVSVDVEPERRKARRERQERTAQFAFCFVTAQVLEIIIVILSLVWLVDYKNGFDWGDDKDASVKEFNFHPLLLVLGLVVINGEAIMLHKLFVQPQCNRLLIKVLHGVLQLIGFIMMVVGLVAVWDFHRVYEYPDMYSLHSWVGVGVCLLFAIQLCIGAVTYLLLPWWAPEKTAAFREWNLPIHVWFGLTILIGSAATACMGLTEKALYSTTTYNQLGPETYIINFLGVAMVVFACLVTYIVVNPAFKQISWTRRDEEGGQDNDGHSAASSDHGEPGYKANGDAETKQ